MGNEIFLTEQRHEWHLNKSLPSPRTPIYIEDRHKFHAYTFHNIYIYIAPPSRTTIVRQI